jgi:hypothetical protein
MARYPDEWYEELDPLIRPPVRLLHDHNIETVQCCQGGPGHSYEYPTIELTTSGLDANGFMALAILEEDGYGVSRVSICWNVQRGLPTERFWQIEMLPFKDTGTGASSEGKEEEE